MMMSGTQIQIMLTTSLRRSSGGVVAEQLGQLSNIVDVYILVNVFVIFHIFVHSMNALREQTAKEDAEMKKKVMESGPQASHGYGGKFGVEKDR